MTLPRGFKATSERRSLEFRAGLGIEATAPIDIEALAAHFGIPVIPGEKLLARERFDEIERLQVGSFSAATFKFEGKTYLVTSPLASEAQRRSHIAHELSHVILEHKLAEIREADGLKFRTCNPDEDEQATAFGETLLLPKTLLGLLIMQGVDTADKIAADQNVPVEAARSRLKSTGLANTLLSQRAEPHGGSK
jgi:hypothetical protein